MRFQMLFEIALESGPIIAHVTTERPFAGVGAHVSLQIFALEERLPTHVTDVVLGEAPSLPPHGGGGARIGARLLGQHVVENSFR